jgi:osmotically inducible protein OsmC
MQRTPRVRDDDDPRSGGMAARSSAKAHWEGSTVEGAGHVSTASDALRQQELLWAARIGEAEDGTTPEELLAAAWSGCYCMAFSFALTNAGHAPSEVDVDASLAFVANPEGGFRIGKGALEVRVAVDGLDEAQVRELAEGAKAGCPVSVALGEVAAEATLDLTVATPAR